MYKTKVLDNGRIELWWEINIVKSLLGNQEELEKAPEQVRKQEERRKFLTHAYKKGKRHHDVVKEQEEE